MNEGVKLIVNHEAGVTDGHGRVWIPYLIQNADGSVNRLGLISRESLSLGELGDPMRYAGASGTTCHVAERGAIHPLTG